MQLELRLHRVTPSTSYLACNIFPCTFGNLPPKPTQNSIAFGCWGQIPHPRKLNQKRMAMVSDPETKKLCHCHWIVYARKAPLGMSAEVVLLVHSKPFLGTHVCLPHYLKVSCTWDASSKSAPMTMPMPNKQGTNPSTDPPTMPQLQYQSARSPVKFPTASCTLPPINLDKSPNS